MTDTVTIQDDAATADPEAPYGRFANGKPRKSPAGTAKGGPKGPRKAAGPKAPSARKSGPKPNFTKSITGALGGLGAVLSAAGFRRRSRALVADGMAVQMAARPIAEGINEVAQVSPALQRILAQAGPAIPFTGLAYALLELGAQIAANHGKQIPGFEVHQPDDLIAAAEMQAQEARYEAQHQEPPKSGTGPSPADMPQQQPDHHTPFATVG